LSAKIIIFLKDIAYISSNDVCIKDIGKVEGKGELKKFIENIEILNLKKNKGI